MLLCTSPCCALGDFPLKLQIVTTQEQLKYAQRVRAALHFGGPHHTRLLGELLLVRLKLPRISHHTYQVRSCSRTWVGGGDCELKPGQVCAPGCLDSSTRTFFLGCFPPEHLRGSPQGSCSADGTLGFPGPPAQGPCRQGCWLLTGSSRPHPTPALGAVPPRPPASTSWAPTPGASGGSPGLGDSSEILFSVSAEGTLFILLTEPCGRDEAVISNIPVPEARGASCRRATRRISRGCGLRAVGWAPFLG